MTMARPEGSLDRPVQPALSELFAGYLQRQASHQAAGIAAPQSVGEVVPFEAVPVQPVDAGLAWTEAVAVSRYFQPQGKTPDWRVPPEWPALVSAQEPAAALSFSFGNYPQLVRNLHMLWHATKLPPVRPAGEASARTAALCAWTAST